MGHILTKGQSLQADSYQDMFAGYMHEIPALCIAGHRSFGYNIHPFLFA